jgi:hypothetical protein
MRNAQAACPRLEGGVLPARRQHLGRGRGAGAQRAAGDERGRDHGFVFIAFALAGVVVVKAMGVGLALAVLLDATLIRVLIVPATMRLLGDLNWWPGNGSRRRRAEARPSERLRAQR